MHKTHTFKAVILAASLVAVSAPASADDWSTRTATGVGEYIAYQGNIALQQVKSDLVRQIREGLRPLQVAQPKASMQSAHNAATRAGATPLTAKP